MDYLLLIAGWIMMYRRAYAWLFAVIIVLCSTYLQLPLEQDMMLGPKHNVADVGLLLYLTFFSIQVLRKGLYTAHPLAKPVCLFLLFLFINGLWDIQSGVSFGDVVRYWKNWALLTVVFLPVSFDIEVVRKVVRILFWITFAFSIVLALQYMAGVVWIGHVSEYGAYTRGAKPPSTAIICFCLAMLDVFGLPPKVRWLACVVFALPVIFCMKMSYFTTICLTLLGCYRLLSRGGNFQKAVKYGLAAVAAVVVVFAAFPVFYQRFQDTLNQSGVTSERQQEGNFSYRINHFSERLDYVLDDPVRSMRGLGYVQERNYHGFRFKYGHTNILGGKAMLDTGDIAWSLLILRLGLLGICVYLVMYSKCLRELWRDHDRDRLVTVYFAYALVALVFMSFGNTLVAQSEFFVIPLMLINADYENSALYMES